ncbi:hypothetical protein [Brevibacillus migulae]|uniref:hypothetical protein n=1 Tax=Brevibacillus migulae TaxID=1644114 RepID=UPI00106EA90B|nr:hypothetical protein [Brevibacillus migulae]
MTEIEKVHQRAGKLVEHVATMEEGLRQITQDALQFTEHYEEEEVAAIVRQIAANYPQFEAWLTRLLEEEAMPAEIVAVNFGLFEEEDGIRLYISGSRAFDEEDFDWAANNDYFPDGRYADIDAYHSFQDILESDFAFGLYLALATSVLYVLTFARQHQELLLTGKDALHLTTGFDDGGLLYMGKVSKSGVQLPHAGK